MELSQGATEQASSIEQLTASIEEISSQTKNNAQNAAHANELADLAKKAAEQGNERMAEMLKSMEDINESSSNISKIIKVIDEIAFQTNILALNAAVEAARAGQHGKGFAVVAEEVRNLAARSADAAKETTALIEGSIKKVEGGTKIATDTATALQKIVDGVAKVSTIVSDITIASNEQASGIAQINQGIVQVSQVVQTNSATSEESAAASEELSSQAELLGKMVRRFHLKKSERSYSNSEEISPEILRMIEQMGAKERTIASFKEARDQVAVSKSAIDLSDKDFGKY
jgi:methyl-accepting chemotaxis protein